ncbi:hypothetical protein N7492_005839 [Penicillium capsulatum]|uniref:Uncharacterized protein n=1 Tax=Penicillium capsulatum TaxID=69766 RepID=A0A9W9LS20_9EURO|nr:hypothetical protein N7492_005839 [Penicillium capsulatum]KAJ6135061.1 hypothetical protein N7512_000221 [Penicillium capsulatum]
MVASNLRATTRQTSHVHVQRYGDEDSPDETPELEVHVKSSMIILPERFQNALDRPWVYHLSNHDSHKLRQLENTTNAGTPILCIRVIPPRSPRFLPTTHHNGAEDEPEKLGSFPRIDAVIRRRTELPGFHVRRHAETDRGPAPIGARTIAAV